MNDDVPFAVQPTLPEIEEEVTTPVVKMPGNSFMQISMGENSFSSDFMPSEILKEPNERPKSSNANVDVEVNDFQNQFTEPTLPKAEPTVSKDTLKSVAENFAFAKDKPQSMLMNFLMNKKPMPLPPMPTMPSPTDSGLPDMMTTRAPPPPMMLSTTQRPMMMWTTPNPNRFKLETSTKLDKSLAGNFINMKMGKKMPTGVKPSVMSKLEKDKISLSPDGNNFMSIQMNLNPDFLMERMSVLKNSFEKNKSLPELKRPLRKVPNRRPHSNMEDRWIKDNKKEIWIENEKTPFTVRPTLPVGHVKLWPQELKPTKKPFTARPKLSSKHWNEERTAQTPFTVKPTKTPVPFNYNSNSPYGAMKKELKSHSYVHHDVKLKSPFESTVNGFHGNQGFVRGSHKSHPQASNLYTTPSTFPDYEIYDDDTNEDEGNYKILQDGYKGIGVMTHPGLHDDRPPYKFRENKEENEGAKATFGGLKFQLPLDGKFPDRPIMDQDTAVLRDLPDLEQLDFDEEVVTGKKGHQYGKSYLKNPYGADFIRLEVDSNRYKHNKTRRIGGIHHIPLKVHGYAETSEFPVSSDTERPLIRHRPRPMRLRPKKQVTKPPEFQSTEKLPLKAMHEVVEKLKLPNINAIPKVMQSLVSNHASWIDKVWASSLLNGESLSTGKSFDNISTSSLTTKEDKSTT